ncbi:methionyl-tRNA formyltransferase [Corynebacterium liangguodongii]|uniref:Methionyl-tRNA formyltransferase n=1 Tax=Corynebacterium liangguodongii TaxID=2079535 RepID=A0A2S0WE68_9CORY|nr:methionyl-tRNA formyltransferase [Corynebacterium liangguodongii]AWB84068.1 methionyl-tRNA formyltransferase [Corynebacterium liangguodongii]PWC00079.1 methionyl-tRNA formyltransferase [Corynebacterium liangguodongii]
MRLVFAGTPEPAAVALERLIASEHVVEAVITRPDARKGRGRSLHPSPVKEVALNSGIEVYTPTTLKENGEIRAALREISPQAIPVVAYGNLIPADMLDIPEHGWINLHFSLLPRWRGAAPVQAAIAAGDVDTGATTFRIDEGLDTGPILGHIHAEIRPRDTADDLLTRLATSGAELLVETMTGLERGESTPVAQPPEGTYAGKITSADARVSWESEAAAIDRQIRAHTPAPGAWTTLCGERIKLGPVEPCERAGLSPGQVSVGKGEVVVGTRGGAVRLGTIQPPGKKMMPAPDWARGIHGANGNGKELVFE